MSVPIEYDIVKHHSVSAYTCEVTGDSDNFKDQRVKLYKFCPSLRLVNLFIPRTPFTALKIMLKLPELLSSS